MFDFESFERELDEQNTALESMIYEMDMYSDYSVAEEGLFSKPKTADDMIAKVQKSVNKKCKTVEDCDDFLAKLKVEEQKFNASLKAMKAAAIQFQKDGDKKALKAAIKPARAELAKTCSIISLKDVGSANNITDEEIKKLKAFLTGARKVVAEKKKALKTGAASESYAYLEYEPAMEAFDTMKLKLRDLCRTLARKCHDFAAKKENNGNESFWTKAETWFNNMAETLEGKVTPEKVKEYEEKIKKKREECERKKQEKAAKKAERAELKQAKKDAKRGIDPTSETDPNQLGNESFTAITAYDIVYQDACEAYYSIVQAGCESFFDIINDEEQTAEEAAFIAGYNSAMEAMQDAQVEQALDEIDTLFDF